MKQNKINLLKLKSGKAFKKSNYYEKKSELWKNKGEDYYNRAVELSEEKKYFNY